VTEEATSVEPGTAPSANATALVLRHLFEPLAAYEGSPFKVTPRLARSWTVKDNRVWEFKLRQGVKHHDGTPLTAEDVKYSLDIYRRDGSLRKANTEGIINVEAVDPQTVRITTDGPRPGRQRPSRPARPRLNLREQPPTQTTGTFPTTPAGPSTVKKPPWPPKPASTW